MRYQRSYVCYSWQPRASSSILLKASTNSQDISSNHFPNNTNLNILCYYQNAYMACIRLQQRWTKRLEYSNLKHILILAVGIGKGIVASILGRPDTVVIAAIRDLSNSSEISSLPTAPGSRLIIVKVDGKSPSDATIAIESLQSQGITHIDVLIANSGVLDQWGPVSEVKSQDLRDHFEINTIAPIALFQAAFWRKLRTRSFLLSQQI